MEGMKTLKIAAVALLVLAAAAVSGISLPEAAQSAGDDEGDGITVTGIGRVETVPDEAEFSLGVTTKAATARGALSANAEQMREVIAALKAVGVAKRDTQTRDVNVGPDYDGDAHPDDDYVASNTVSVLVRELDRAGAVLDAAARAGANNVYGPSLTRSNRESLEAKALKDAVANARARAKALAGAAGVELGRVTAIDERPPAFEGGPMRAASAATTPIEEGTQEIEETVSVTFAIE
jgi:uncharacterized protein YggE